MQIKIKKRFEKTQTLRLIILFLSKTNHRRIFKLRRRKEIFVNTIFIYRTFKKFN